MQQGLSNSSDPRDIALILSRSLIIRKRNPFSLISLDFKSVTLSAHLTRGDGAVVGVGGGRVVGERLGEVVGQLAGPVEHVASVVGAVPHLDLGRLLLGLLLSQADADEGAVRDELHAVAGRADLLVDLEIIGMG